MRTAKKSATKKAPSKRVAHHDELSNQTNEMQPQHFDGNVTTGASSGVKPNKVKKLSTEDRLEGLIAFLKKHGLHFDGAAIEE